MKAGDDGQVTTVTGTVLPAPPTVVTSTSPFANTSSGGGEQGGGMAAISEGGSIVSGNLTRLGVEMNNGFSIGSWVRLGDTTGAVDPFVLERVVFVDGKYGKHCC